MKIHIVHLPHTFSHLLELSYSYRQYGFEKVILVANGFDHDSYKELRELTSHVVDVEILDVPTRRIMSHGEALNYAFKHSPDEYFCFADHDIFPVENMHEVINDFKSEGHDAICFGYRPENSKIEYKGFAASALESPSGIPLVTSFFSVFKRSALLHVMSQYKVGFEQYFRKSQVPEKLKHLADVQSLNEPFLMDTCKVLSLAMFLEGKTVNHYGDAYVCHLGGICGAIARYRQNEEKMKNRFELKALPSVEELKDYYIKNQQRHPEVLHAKRVISDYALHLILALRGGSEPPAFTSEDPVFQDAAARIKNALTELKFGNQFC